MADRQTQLLEEILAEQKALRGDVQNLKQGQAETNKRLDTLEHRQETVEHGIGALSATLQQIAAQIGTSQADTIDALKDLLLPPLESHEERITTLEEEVGLKPRKH